MVRAVFEKGGDVRVATIVAATGASVALAVTGCGSSSDQTAKFKSGYLAIRGPLDRTGQGIAVELTRAPKQTDVQVAAAFSGLARRFGAQVTQLAKLKPPSDLAADWIRVIRAATRIEADLLGVATAARQHSSSLARSAGASLTRNAQALSTAVAPVKSKLGLK
jgi:hypothetical protein